MAGAITDIVDRTSDAVDLFVTGHTHQPYVCSAANNSLIDGRPVTSASSFGRLVTNIGFKLDHKTKDIKDVTADNTIVTRTQPAAPDIQQLIDSFNTFAAPIANQLVGRISATINRAAAPSGENPLGNLIADAQLADTDDADRGDADIALMNPGGVRADLVFDSPAGTGGAVTYGEAFSVQPFNNIVTTNTFTGAQLLDVLKDQWCGPALEAQVVLLPSSTLTYTFSRATATAISDTACATAANPVSNVQHQRRAARHGGHVPGDDEQLPRRRRGRVPVAARGHEPDLAARLRRRLAGPLPRAHARGGADRAGADQPHHRRSVGMEAAGEAPASPAAAVTRQLRAARPRTGRRRSARDR